MHIIYTSIYMICIYIYTYGRPMAQLQVYSNKLAFTHALNYARTTATPDMIFFCADNRDHCCIWYCADHRVVFVYVCRLYADNRDMEALFFFRADNRSRCIYKCQLSRTTAVFQAIILYVGEYIMQQDV